MMLSVQLWFFYIPTLCYSFDAQIDVVMLDMFDVVNIIMKIKPAMKVSSGACWYRYFKHAIFQIVWVQYVIFNRQVQKGDEVLREAAMRQGDGIWKQSSWGGQNMDLWNMDDYFMFK